MRTLILIFVFFLFLFCNKLHEGNTATSTSSSENHVHSKTISEVNNIKVKNIILMIGDGMGLNQIMAGYVKNKGKLFIQNFKCIGLSKTHSSDNFNTDSGAAATAIASGKKTYNGAVGVDSDKKPLKTILEIAKEKKLSTGLVATSSITHATPAAFVAHRDSRLMENEIAIDIVNSGIDVFIGGGKSFFADKINLLKQKGYQVVETIEDFQKIENGKTAGLVADLHLNSIMLGRGNFLPLAAKKTIALLSKNSNGFFLMIEGSQIDWGGHENNVEYIATEMIDFDNAIKEALMFAEKDGNTLLIVTADHEVGGLAITNGSYETGEIVGDFTTPDHTGTMVPVFAYGPNAELFMGIYDNTDIFYKMISAYGFDIQ